jgi:predicted ATPase
MESVELFVERARAARPGFALDDDNAPAVAAICRRVDGLPLAIELAAARINVLTPGQILERLDHRLAILSGSRRDVMDRQRTLRGAIDWSYELLNDDEKAAFCRFAVFAGGADLDAALAVLDPTAELETDSIDLLGSLVARSLLRSSDDSGRARFMMLETIREYALERLASSGDEERIRDRHADYYGNVAAASIDVLFAPDRAARLDLLDLEMPNLRAAIEWSIERGAFERATRTALGLREFWRTRSHLVEARRLLDRVLDAWPADQLPAARADVLGVAGELAAWHADYGRARELTEIQIALLAEVGDRARLAQAYNNMAWGNLAQRPEASRDFFEKAIAVATEVGDDKNQMAALQGMAIALFRLGELQRARETALAAIDVANVSRDEYTNLFNIMTLGMIESRLGSPGRAAQLFADALHRAEAASAEIGMVVSLDAISLLVFERGDTERSATIALVSDRVRREVGGAPTMELIGYRAILDRIREKDPTTLERVAATISNVTTADAIAAAYSAAAAIADETS